MKQRNSQSLRWALVLGTAIISSGCSLFANEVEVQEKVVIEKSAPLPPGVVNYCWEEPITTNEQNGPGLDTEGKWYHPSYVAVREVRMGKWRPCEPVYGEKEGESYNER